MSDTVGVAAGMATMAAQELNETFPRTTPTGSGNLSQSPPNLATSSPLQLFVQAKRAINGIYTEVADYVNNASRFLNAAATGSSEAVSIDDSDRVSEIQRKVEGIREVLQRDHMKVVFFGRTSNGKSTAINALLGDRILPTGIGHTTSCFLQVEGSTEAAASAAYILTEGSSERKPVASISQLANALCEEKLAPDSKIRIVWPKSKCKMLAEEVVIIDSPGIDVEADLDDWIDKFCLDSDVFVLVANAESTLMLTEKKFFHKVSARLSNPNIFVVHNRSDAFAGEDMVHEVKRQHLDRAVHFLVDELAVCSKQEAEDRIFFISAKEALQARLQEAKGQPPQISADDFFTRYLEFQSFEKKFAHCLSNTAVHTKFAQHTYRGRNIVRDVAHHMAQIHAAAVEKQAEQTRLRRELVERRDYTEKQLEEMTIEMKERIHQITEDVEYKVGKALSEEIRRLSVLVDEFNDPFHPDPLVLNVYKSKLNHHIENGVGSNLRNRLSSDLQVNMESHQREMVDRMLALLPEERQQGSKGFLLRKETFEVLYHLHCDNLCSDFQEDLRFRFSLGLASLVQRFMGVGQSQRSRQRNVSSYQSPNEDGNLSVPRGLSSHSPLTPTNEFHVPQDDWSLVSKIALASLTSHGTMGGLILGGLMLKTVGWRFILATGAVYSMLYAYERLTWTTQAKCREFKRQYVDHVARKLRLIVDMTSANCSHQVQQELSSTFARLCHLVDETTADIKEDIGRIDHVVAELKEAVNKSKVLKNEASFLTSKLDHFEHTYLKESSE